jgi:DNA (cytosine-5)-methyltransferase 1
MENVPGMLSVGGRNVADEAAADLADRGYRVGYAALIAVWYGVPHYLELLFFIRIHSDCGGHPSMPRATHFAALPSGYLRPNAQWTAPLPFIQHSELPVDTAAARLPATTADDALGDLPPLTDHLSGWSGSSVSAVELPYPCRPHSGFARLMRSWPGLQAPDTVRDHIIRKTPRDYETFKRMQPGDRYPAALAIARARFHEELQLRRSVGSAPAPGTPEYVELERKFIPPYPEEIFVDKWRKLVPDQPSWTVPAHLSKDAYSHIHYDSDQARAISIREAARLQSFPDAFAFSGNMGERFRQVGNAVPPLLAWAVACAVLESLGYQANRPEWKRTADPHQTSAENVDRSSLKA